MRFKSLFYSRPSPAFFFFFLLWQWLIEETCQFVLQNVPSSGFAWLFFLVVPFNMTPLSFLGPVNLRFHRKVLFIPVKHFGQDGQVVGILCTTPCITIGGNDFLSLKRHLLRSRNICHFSCLLKDTTGPEARNVNVI